MQYDYKIRVLTIGHRNGVGGVPFHAVLFRDSGDEAGVKLGVVFDAPAHVAVLDVARLAECDVAGRPVRGRPPPGDPAPEQEDRSGRLRDGGATMTTRHRSARYAYAHDRDGCDDTFDVWDTQADRVIRSVPFWDDAGDEEAEAEEEVCRVVRELNRHAPRSARALDDVA